jgi:hypothetical protein
LSAISHRKHLPVTRLLLFPFIYTLYEEFALFKAAGEANREIPFGAVFSAAETKVVVFKQYEDASTLSAFATTEEISNFVKQNSLPLVVRVSFIQHKFILTG